MLVTPVTPTSLTMYFPTIQFVPAEKTDIMFGHANPQFEKLSDYKVVK